MEYRFRFRLIYLHFSYESKEKKKKYTDTQKCRKEKIKNSGGVNPLLHRKAVGMI